MACRDSRKIFRLCRTYCEVQLIFQAFNNIIWQPDRIKYVLDLLSKVGFALYYSFDNIVILSTIQFLKIDKKPWYEISNMCWLIGLCFGVLKDLHELKSCLSQSLTTKQEKLEQQRLVIKLVLNMVSKIGDMMSAANGARITVNYLGGEFSEKVVSFGGLISGLIGSFNLLNK